jgi:hypothetical protein
MVRGAMLVADADLQFDWLFADEFPAVMRAVYLIVHDLGRAEDITQDAFVQLLRHWKKVSRYDRPGAWGPAGRHPAGRGGGPQGTGADLAGAQR